MQTNCLCCDLLEHSCWDHFLYTLPHRLCFEDTALNQETHLFTLNRWWTSFSATCSTSKRMSACKSSKISAMNSSVIRDIVLAAKARDQQSSDDLEDTLSQLATTLLTKVAFEGDSFIRSISIHYRHHPLPITAPTSFRSTLPRHQCINPSPNAGFLIKSSFPCTSVPSPDPTPFAGSATQPERDSS